jgi:hypothetical protein
MAQVIKHLNVREGDKSIMEKLLGMKVDSLCRRSTDSYYTAKPRFLQAGQAIASNPSGLA